MTLDNVAMETPVRIVGFKSLADDEKLRLSALGVREETVITKVMRTPFRDPVECLAGPQLLALDAWLLDHILVAPHEDSAAVNPA